MVNFRKTYGGNVLAVHRNGEEVSGKIGRIFLRPGDLLLLAYSKYKQINVGQDLYLFARVKKPKLMGQWRAGSTIVGAIAAISIAAFTPVSLFVSLLVFIAFLLMSGTATMRDVRRGIETQIIFIAAFAFVLGKVMLETDTARFVSDVIIHMTDGFGLIGFLFGIYLATNLITEFVTNIAAASLMFPVAFTSAGTLGIDPVPLVLTVAFAASASFISPIGYQTNLIVYGTGDYSFKDFFRIGLPLSLLYMVVTVLILAVSYGFLSF
jgi:di/tricarboxylate transporter